HRRLSSGDYDRKALGADAALIVTHTDRLAELLTTLFDVSCLEAGLLSISRWRTDLATVAREVTESMRSTARHHVKVLADQSVVGEWDERRIRQVLMNLLSNALKYSPEGSTVTVSVAAGERCATGRVRDEGIGLADTELAQLFRRGYRAESARNATGGGLGLYFSNGIVAAHGGRMWAESPGRGQGSTFCFILPLREERRATRPAADVNKIDPALLDLMQANPLALLPVIVEMEHPLPPFVGAPNVGRAMEALGLLRAFGVPVAELSLIDGAAGFANAAGIDAISL